MKRLFNVLVLTLAMNFLAVAGLLSWLYQSKHLDREKVHAIREILFPRQDEAAPSTQPSAEPTTQPIMRLEELLAKTAGRPATEQVQFIQQAFDAQMTQLERRERELRDLGRQVELARQQLARDRAAHERAEADLSARQQETSRLASDEGFQDTLQLYNTMSGKQVKSIFMSLDDATVARYLQAMEPRAATRIIKEFKTPEEVARIQKILERIRQASANASANASASASQGKE